VIKESLPQIKSSEHISGVEEEAFDLIIPEHEDLAIKLEEFEEIYGKEEIARDNVAVERKRAKFEKIDGPLKRRARLLEAILSQQIELSEWFGKDAATITPSEYDDLFNGVDMIAEFERDDSFQYMAMGVDVTSSVQQVKKKLAIIKEHIRDGTLTQVKYFKSERNDIQGRMGKIPLLVVGADSRTISELANLWLATYKSKHPEVGLDKLDIEELKQKAREAREILAKHRAAILVLKELKAQLEVFIEFARGVKSTEVEARYKNLLRVIDEIIKEKNISKSDELENESDNVYSAIMEELKTFLSE